MSSLCLLDRRRRLADFYPAKGRQADGDPHVVRAATDHRCHPTGDLNYLVTAFNKPFTANGFGNRFRKWCDSAGLTQCSAHGLRKASAARMAELGASSHQIMSIGGWETLKEVERYTKATERKRMAGQVRDLIENELPQPLGGLPQPLKKKNKNNSL